jgi:class 3 adenylate cyclase/NO-binding membrane sensor protein with MHYT domain
MNSTTAAATLAEASSTEYELPFEWSPGLIIISYLVAVAASYSTVTLLQLKLHPAMVAVAAFNLSVAGIWSMHFIGMEALHLSVKMNFDPGMTTLSAVLAFLCTLCGVGLVHWRVSNTGSMKRSAEFQVDISIQAHIEAVKRAPHATIVVSGLFIAAGVCGMHYMGQLAMRVPARTEPRVGVIIASVFIAITAATAALYLAFVLPLSCRFPLPTAMVMGVAVCGMHYTAIYGFRYFVDPRSVEYMAAMSTEHQMSWTPYVMVASLITSFSTLAYTTMRYQAMIRTAMGHLEKYVPPPIIASIFDSQLWHRAESGLTNEMIDGFVIRVAENDRNSHSGRSTRSDTGSIMLGSPRTTPWGSHNDYRRAARTREIDPCAPPPFLAAGRLAKFRGVNWLDLAMRPSRATVGFIDVVDFTTHAETMTQDMLMQEMAHFNQRCSTIIENSGGYVDKYLGDAIMAVWNGVVPLDDHAVRGVAACFSCVTPTGDAANCKFEAKAGLQSGQVLMGNVGSTSRLNFTVLGDTVNQASRIEGLTRHYAARLIIGQGTQHELGDDGGGFVLRFLDEALLKGKTRCVRVYEVLADAVRMDQAHVQSAELVAAAYELLHEHFCEGDAATVIQHLTAGACLITPGAGGAEDKSASLASASRRKTHVSRAVDESVYDLSCPAAVEDDESVQPVMRINSQYMPTGAFQVTGKENKYQGQVKAADSPFVSRVEVSTKNRLMHLEVYLRDRRQLGGADGFVAESIAELMDGDVPSQLLLARCHEMLQARTSSADGADDEAMTDKKTPREAAVMRFTAK